MGGTNLILGSRNFGTVLLITQPIIDGIEQTLHQWKQLDVLYPGVPKKLEKYYDVLGEFPEKNRKKFRKNFSENFIKLFQFWVNHLEIFFTGSQDAWADYLGSTFLNFCLWAGRGRPKVEIPCFLT